MGEDDILAVTVRTFPRLLIPMENRFSVSETLVFSPRKLFPWGSNKASKRMVCHVRLAHFLASLQEGRRSRR